MQKRVKVRTIQTVLVLLLFLAIAAYAQDDLTQLRRQAEQGDAEAQFRLGAMYSLGQGVPQSDSEAVVWFRKAAEQGNPCAQYNLGIMYFDGRAVSQNDSEAVMWFRETAQHGHDVAYYDTCEPHLYFGEIQKNQGTHQLYPPAEIVVVWDWITHETRDTDSLLAVALLGELHKMNIQAKIAPSREVYQLLRPDWVALSCFHRGWITQRKALMLLNYRLEQPGIYKTVDVGIHTAERTVIEKGKIVERSYRVPEYVQEFHPKGEKVQKVSAEPVRSYPYYEIPWTYGRFGGSFPLSASIGKIASATADKISKSMDKTRQLITTTLCDENWVSAFDTYEDAEKVMISQDKAYVFTPEGLEVIDIANSQSPIGLQTCRRPLDYGHGGTISGNYAFMANARDSVEIIDISLAGDPVVVGTYACDECSSPLLMLTVGNTLYLSGWKDFKIIDFPNKSNPREIKNLKTGSSPLDAKVVGDYVYLVTGKGLQIIDVTNPQKPRKAGSCKIVGSPSGVDIARDYAYVATDKGMQVVDVADSKAPRVVGSYVSAAVEIGDTSAVAIAGEHAYLAHGGTEFEIINIANPQAPYLVGRHSVPGEIRDMEVSGNYLYVACAGTELLGGSLQIFDITKPQSLSSDE